MFNVFWTLSPLFKPIVGKDSVKYLVLNKSVAIAQGIGCQKFHVGHTSVSLLLFGLRFCFKIDYTRVFIV